MNPIFVCQIAQHMVFACKGYIYEKFVSLFCRELCGGKVKGIIISTHL